MTKILLSVAVGAGLAMTPLRNSFLGDLLIMISGG